MYLPSDVIVSIISFCPISTVTNAKLTCKSWNATLCTEIFWKTMCQNQLGITYDQPIERSWELEFKRNFEIGNPKRESDMFDLLQHSVTPTHFYYPDSSQYVTATHNSRTSYSAC